MSRSLEQQARRYLRLFPEWMREVRGEEAVGLVLDQLPADRDRLPLRSKVDLVRAGLHARRKGTPPPWVLRTASRAPGTWPGRGAAVPAAWRPWSAPRRPWPAPRLSLCPRANEPGRFLRGRRPFSCGPAMRRRRRV